MVADGARGKAPIAREKCDAVAHLAAAATARWQSLWDGLSAMEKRTAALAYLSSAEDMPAAQQSAAEVIARECRTRPVAVLSWPLERRADRLSRAARIDTPLVAALIARFLVSAKQPMVTRFLDTVGVPHSNGEIDSSAIRASCEPERLRSAVLETSTGFSKRDAELFLEALDAQRVPCLAGLNAIRVELAQGGQP